MNQFQAIILTNHGVVARKGAPIDQSVKSLATGRGVTVIARLDGFGDEVFEVLVYNGADHGRKSEYLGRLNNGVWEPESDKAWRQQ